ncbi:MAG: hypothetical protein IPH11_15630 [Ignavibacteriales bacterium]|nr:hypothetical protein [Ignavibacteriales bacterium]
MSPEQAKKIFNQINQTKLFLLKKDLINYAVEYSRIRVEWYLASDEGKEALEDSRSRKHNAFIDACNILSREMLKNNEDASWRKDLGNDRKVIGDLACYVHCFLGLSSR